MSQESQPVEKLSKKCELCLVFADMEECKKAGLC